MSAAVLIWYRPAIPNVHCADTHLRARIKVTARVSYF